jgi:hypothetical protein
MVLRVVLQGIVFGKLLARRCRHTPSHLAPTLTVRLPARCKERPVFLLVDAFLAGVIVWAFGRRGRLWILRLDEPGQQRVRLAAAMLVTAVSAMGIAVLGLQLGGEDHAHVLGWTVGAAVSLGGAVYAAGLLAWWGGQALGLCILGWVLMVMALVIRAPSPLGSPWWRCWPWPSPPPGAGRAGRRVKLTPARAAQSAGALAEHHYPGGMRVETVGALRNRAVH